MKSSWALTAFVAGVHAGQAVLDQPGHAAAAAAAFVPTPATTLVKQVRPAAPTPAPVAPAANPQAAKQVNAVPAARGFAPATGTNGAKGAANPTPGSGAASMNGLAKAVPAAIPKGTSGGGNAVMGGGGKQAKGSSDGNVAPNVANSMTGSNNSAGNSTGAGLAKSWKEVSCGFGSLTKSTNNPNTQWVDSQADAAWSDALASCKSTGGSFTDCLSDFFNTRPGMNCASVGSENCDITINCGQKDSPNAPVNSPAGYMIINSIIGLHVAIDNYYNGLTKALADMTGDMGSFATSFAPQIDHTKNEKLTLDGVSLGYSLVSAFTFNMVLKPFIPAIEGVDPFAWLKDSTNALVTNSITIAKDSLSGPNPLNTQNDIEGVLSTAIQGWQTNLGGLASNLFGKNPDLLGKLIKGGLAFNPTAKVGPLDISNQVKKVLFAWLMTYAWSKSTGQTMNPAILVINDCTSSLDKVGSIKFDKGAESSAVCIDNKRYVVGNYRDPHEVFGKDILPSLFKPTWNQLSGLDKLDGTKFGGLVLTDVIRSAISCQAAGGKQINPTSYATASGADIDVGKAPLVCIPICGADQMKKNIQAKKQPCA